MYSKKQSYRTNREQDKMIAEMGLRVTRIFIGNPQNNSLRSKQSTTGKLYPGGA